MSNNKQSMKLYTEEQMKEAIRMARSSYALFTTKFMYEQDEVLREFAPIKLPSDEEIEKMGKDVIVYNDTKRGWFIEGLKFMRDKIQGGNNEQ